MDKSISDEAKHRTDESAVVCSRQQKGAHFEKMGITIPPLGILRISPLSPLKRHTPDGKSDFFLNARK